MIPETLGRKVIVRVPNPYYDGEPGVLTRWICDNWYAVTCKGTELFVDISRGEIEFVREPSPF